MPAPTDMMNYVTRAELREELESLEQRIDQKLEQKFAPYGSLGAFGTALIDHIERRMERQSAELRRQLNEDLARHVNAANEAQRRYFEALDDKYASLPARVERLEATVFPPKRQRRR